MKRLILALSILTTSAMAGEVARSPTSTTPTTSTAAATSNSASNSNSASASRSASRSTASQSQTVSVNTTGSGSRSGQGRTPDVLAPSLSGGNPCGLGATLGGSGPGAGGILGWMWEGGGCERRQKAALLHNMGRDTAAKEALCFDDEARRALFSGGDPCARDSKGWDR